MPWTHDTKPLLITKGPLILNLESVFFHWQRYPKRRVTPVTPPLHETARPRELEQPYRTGHGHMFRFPLTRRGVVIGYWEPAGEGVLEDEESERIMQAVEGAMIPGVTATEISQWSRGREPWWAVALDKLLEWWRGARPVEGSVIPIRRDDEEEYDDVIPYDGAVYDLEDARVQLPGQQ